MNPRQSPEKPPWFDITKYAHAQELDDIGWLYQISVRLFLEAVWYGEIDLDYAEHQPYTSDADIWRDQARYYWSRVIEEGVLRGPSEEDAEFPDPYRAYEYQHANSKYAPIRTLSTNNIYSALESWCCYNRKPVEDISEGSAIHRTSLTDILWSTFPGDDISQCFIGIDLNVADKELISHFAAWLKSERESIADARPANAVIGEGRFGYWRQFNVLPYWDLSIWMNGHGFCYTHSEFADLLFTPGSEYDLNTVRTKVRANLRRMKDTYYSLRSHYRSVGAS